MTNETKIEVKKFDNIGDFFSAILDEATEEASEEIDQEALNEVLSTEAGKNLNDLLSGDDHDKVLVSKQDAHILDILKRSLIEGETIYYDCQNPRVSGNLKNYNNLEMLLQTPDEYLTQQQYDEITKKDSLQKEIEELECRLASKKQQLENL